MHGPVRRRRVTPRALLWGLLRQLTTRHDGGSGEVEQGESFHRHVVEQGGIPVRRPHRAVACYGENFDVAGALAAGGDDVGEFRRRPAERAGTALTVVCSTK